MSTTKKVSEANQIFSELLSLNEIGSICDCPYPQNQVLHAYKMLDIVLRASSFVDPVIFALEYHQRGSRIFFCCSRIHFAHYFFRVRCLKPEYTTWHEILTDLNTTNLYFDLEYYTLHNPNLNGEKVGDEFKSTLKNYLIQHSGLDSMFKTNFSDKDIQFVEFDATIPTKFSRHLIVYLKDFCFKSATHVGRFVEQLGKSVEFKEQFTFFDKEGSKKVSMMDFSVYQQGQNLRMLGSPKFGRTNTLHYVKPLQNHEFRFHEDCPLCSEMLLNTLATVSNPLEENFHCHLLDDPVFNLNRSIVETFANLLFLDDQQISYQFLCRTFACIIIDIQNLYEISNQPKFDSMMPLLKKVVEKIQLGNTFWSFNMTDWDTIITAVEKLIKAFHFVPNGEIIRFELGNVLVALDALDSERRSIIEDPTEPEIPKETPKVVPKLAKKCRANMSHLLRFLQQLEASMHENGKKLDFVALNENYLKLVHNLPNLLKADFPTELNMDNLGEIKILAALLSNQEDEIRNERSEKVASKTKARMEALQRRNDEEEEFRTSLKSKMNNSDDSMLLRLCRIILHHSMNLKFNL